jgi:hypothetical protein
MTHTILCCLCAMLIPLLVVLEVNNIAVMFSVQNLSKLSRLETIMLFEIIDDYGQTLQQENRQSVSACNMMKGSLTRLCKHKTQHPKLRER